MHKFSDLLLLPFGMIINTQEVYKLLVSLYLLLDSIK